MSNTNDLLIEIGTEELPPKALQSLSNAFTAGVALLTPLICLIHGMPFQ